MQSGKGKELPEVRKSKSKSNSEKSRRAKEQAWDEDVAGSLLNFNLGFDYDFELDNKDEMSTLKKKVKTEEEI